jgi:hypothetical protein
MAGQRSIEISFSIVDKTRFDEFELRFDETMTPAFKLITETVAGDAIRRSPSDRSFFIQSIQPSVEKLKPGVMAGYVFSTVPHAAVIEGVDEEGNETEFGRRPGTKFPNFTELRAWVERHIVVDQLRSDFVGPVRENLQSEEVIDEITFFIGRKIVREGIKPKRPIGTAFRDKLAWIDAQLDLAIDETLAKI